MHFVEKVNSLEESIYESAGCTAERPLTNRIGKETIVTSIATNEDPYANKDRMDELQKRLVKNKPRDKKELRRHLLSNLNFVASLGYQVKPGSRFLDVGCGIGDTVLSLLNMGYDAYGIDVLELWDRDFGQYWEVCDKPEGDYVKRLHAVDPGNYRLPFPDGYFDYALSDQVFEHVSNYEEVYAEVARILKPGAISLHRFPGPNGLIEGHLNVPFPVLCYSKTYLALWAMLGRRSSRQADFNWRETLLANIDMMRFCHYPTKGELRRRAGNVKVNIQFMECQELVFRSVGRLSSILAKVPTSFRPAARWAASWLSQRVMIIEGKGK
jgi:SAM-dependent methyltransferase